tara:strand:+ start:4356 stop:4631 length:276 start_codon:yes stop_codon:yes gene_type:complete
MPLRDIERQSFGEGGAVFLTDTDSASGGFCAVTVIADAVFGATTAMADFTEGTKNLFGNTNTVTVPAGITIYGNFSVVALDSGQVLAYKSL